MMRHGPGGYFPKDFSLHHSWYMNAKPNLMANNALKYRRIDPELRAHLQAQWNQPVRWPLVLLLGLLVVLVVPAYLGFRKHQRMPAVEEGS